METASDISIIKGLNAKRGCLQNLGKAGGEVRGPYWTLVFEITQPYLQSRTQKNYCCPQYTHLQEPSWWHHSDVRKASLPCLMQVPLTGKTCNAARPLPARESSKWSFLFSNSWNTERFLQKDRKRRQVPINNIQH